MTAAEIYQLESDLRDKLEGLKATSFDGTAGLHHRSAIRNLRAAILSLDLLLKTEQRRKVVEQCNSQT